MASKNYNTQKLRQLIEALAAAPSVKVGILGNSQRDDPSEESNSTIGWRHEFGIPAGSAPLPQRSFLRMPLHNYLQKELVSKKVFSQTNINKIVREKSTRSLMEKIGVLGVGVVLKAFDSGGFGTWAPLSQYTLDRKKTTQILVETQQLRNSIDYEVVTA